MSKMLFNNDSEHVELIDDNIKIILWRSNSNEYFLRVSNENSPGSYFSRSDVGNSRLLYKIKAVVADLIFNLHANTVIQFSLWSGDGLLYRRVDACNWVFDNRVVWSVDNFNGITGKVYVKDFQN